MAYLPCLCLLFFPFLFQPTTCSSNFSSSSSSTPLLLCPHDQSLSLLQFKNSFSRGTGCYPITESWKEDTDCCSWYGVTCDSKTGHVIGLDLPCSMLQGTISSNSTLFLLPHLQKLDLSRNNFRGSPISVKFGQFLELTHLNLYASYFAGLVPAEISHLSRLLSLDLSYNYELMLVTTSFIMIVQNLTKLQQLHLSYINMSLVAPNSLQNLSSSLSSLQLQSCGLKGEFPVNILGRLNLQVLDLGRNYDLSGSFPKSNGSRALTTLFLFSTRISMHLEQDYFSNLKSLQFLYLDNCNIIGSNLELFGNLTQLTSLELSYNNFSGEIPSSLGNLLHLKHLYLQNNNFTGQIPQTLANLTHIIRLDLSKNNIGGKVPSFLGNFRNLTDLDLSYNNFSGLIPSQLSNLSALTDLRLSYNFLHGTIPSFLFSLPSLLSLDFSKNLLTGHINQFQYHNSLEFIDFSDNMLSGVIPSSIFKVVNLNFLLLSSNYEITGDIPSSICNLKSLRLLELSDNNLSGLIPHCLGNFTNNLLVLHLGANNLQGTIPSAFLEGNALRYLNLYDNNLKGPIPPSIINCKNLQFLDLGNNEIEDAFPYFLETLPKLQVLILRSNKFYGSVKTSSSNYSFPRLQILDLSNNNLSGILPTNFKTMMKHDQNMKNMYLGSDVGIYGYSVQITWKGVEIVFRRIWSILTSIDLSGNKFTGKIPELIGKLTSLQSLNFSHNYLTGPIPPSLGNLTNLESLDLSSNFLVGRIPVQLVALTFLQVLGLSNNRLEGPIPRGKQFNTFDNRSYEGNSGLCDFPLPNCNIGERQPTQLFQEEEEDIKLADGFGWKVALMGYGFGLLFGFTMGCVMFKTRKPAWLVRKIECEILQEAKFLRRILA